MSNLSTEGVLLDAVAGCPGASAGAIAHHLGMDRSNVRRDLKKLCRDGKVTAQDTGNGYAFYPIGSMPVRSPEFPKSTGNLPHVIDLGPGSYTDITDSRLAPVPRSPGAVVVHRMPGTPIAGARSLVPAPRRIAAVALPPALAHGFNSMFAFDPDGVQTIAWLTQQTANREQEENARLRAELAVERRKAAHAAVAREAAQRQAEMDNAFKAIASWRSRPTSHEVDDEDDDPNERQPSLLEQARRERAGRGNRPSV